MYEMTRSNVRLNFTCEFSHNPIHVLALNTFK